MPRLADEPGARGQRALLGLGGRRLDRLDPAQEEGRAEEGQRVGADGQRRGQQLSQQPAQAWPADERQRPAGVDQRVPLDVLVLGDQRHEQRGVRHREQHAQRPGGEGHREQLRERQHPERVAHRDAGHQHEPAQVGADHDGAAAAAAVDPGPCGEREQQARQPLQRAQVAHVGGAGVQDQHGGQRHGHEPDLVAEHGDRLAAPVAPERPVTQQQAAPAGCQPADHSFAPEMSPGKARCR